ncbi:hypothetical protein ACVB8X_42750 [Streptomyces sp. NRAIS4]
MDQPAGPDHTEVLEGSPACACTAPPAGQRGFTPPALSALTEQEVARRLCTGTRPHLAAELATACFTAASRTQPATARLQDAALDGTVRSTTNATSARAA